MLENLEERLLEYETAEEFLTDIKKEFRGEYEKGVQVAELKRLEQESKTMEDFIQEFRRVARGSGYGGRLLIEEFKREMNSTVC